MASSQATDSFVDEVLNIWTHRFVSCGLPLADLESVSSTVESWDDWCRTFIDLAEQYEALGETALEAGNRLTAGAHYRRASLCFHYGSNVWHEDPALRDETHQRAVDAFRAAADHLDPPVRRVEAPYDPGGFSVPGNLRVPQGATETTDGVPLIVMLPGLDSIKEEHEAYGAAVRDRGMATLIVDGPGQGETWYEQAMTPVYPDAISAVVDHVRAIDPDGVDTDRLGVYGFSLGGFYAPYVAARDDRFEACVGVSGPFTVGPASRWGSDLLIEQFKWACKTESLVEVDEITESMTLRDDIDQLDAPTLIVTGTEDVVVPPAQSERIADRAPQGEYRLYDGGAHVCNNLWHRYRADVADWFIDTLSV